jgi:uncharacterized PurR-regulated membrane protein YhhQ (DUF165 family)
MEDDMIYVFMYLAAIVAANLLVAQFGPAISIVNAFLFIGLDLTARDALHERWHGRHLVRNMAALIAAGSLLSWLLNRDAGQIALASFLAFAAAAAADTFVYHRLLPRPWWQKINGSNMAGAGVDSIVFPLVAFGWPPLVWVMAGQFAAKVAGGAVWSLILRNRLEVKPA